MIAYEWDEAKRRTNLSEHKLDFEDAWRVYEAEGKVTYRSLYPYEERWIDLAEIEGVAAEAAREMVERVQKQAHASVKE